MASGTAGLMSLGLMNMKEKTKVNLVCVCRMALSIFASSFFSSHYSPLMLIALYLII